MALHSAPRGLSEQGDFSTRVRRSVVFERRMPMMTMAMMQSTVTILKNRFVWLMRWSGGVVVMACPPRPGIRRAP
jgi:hypothetical protein